VAVESQQVEDEVDDVPRRPFAERDAFCSSWKLVRPSGSTTAISPSRIAERARTARSASAIVGKRAVQSFPFRLISRALPPSTRQPMR
jgi:hypothetical protein